MIKGIEHIAIVVKNLDEAVELYSKVLGCKPARIETIPEQGVKAAMIPMGEGAELELLEPINPDSGVGKFLEKKGQGVHHIAFEVDDIAQELKAMADKGVELIDKNPRTGLAGKVGFLHPKSTGGVLMELIEKV